MAFINFSLHPWRSLWIIQKPRRVVHRGLEVKCVYLFSNQSERGFPNAHALGWRNGDLNTPFRAKTGGASQQHEKELSPEWQLHA